MRSDELYEIAAGLNIEGGYPQQILVKSNPNRKTIWVNTILILDRPLVDNVLFDELFANNRYKLLESAIDVINEHNFLASYLMMILYYIHNGQTLVNKTNEEQLNIVVHFHQDKKCQPLVQLLDSFLNEAIKLSQISTNNVKLSYQTDNRTFATTVPNYHNTDILMSFSQCAGLDPNLLPGTILIPNKFIPYSITEQKIYLTHSYDVPNDLNLRLTDIVASQFNKMAVDFVNSRYKSENRFKLSDYANYFSETNFLKSDILQVNDLWNPIDPAEEVEVIKN